MWTSDWFYERESYADSGLWLGSITVLHWVYFIRNTLTKVILLIIAITHTIPVFCWNMQQPIIKKIKSKKKTIWHFVFRNTCIMKLSLQCQRTIYRYYFISVSPFPPWKWGDCCQQHRFPIKFYKKSYWDLIKLAEINTCYTNYSQIKITWSNVTNIIKPFIGYCSYYIMYPYYVFYVAVIWH